MAHYPHLHHHGRHWSAAAPFQPRGGSVPVDPSTGFLVYSPQTHVYFCPYHGWFPLQYTWNMAPYSDDGLQMIDENLVIDASTFPRTIHDQQQMIDGHSIIDLNLLPSHMIDENLVIDASTFPRTIHDDQQQLIDGHSIIDLNLLPSHDTQHLSGSDVRNRNRGGALLSEEAISKHMKTRAATREDTAEICTVCQDDLHEQGNNELIATLHCGHRYHSNCIRRWLLEKNVCPLCNAIAIIPEDI